VRANESTPHGRQKLGQMAACLAVQSLIRLPALGVGLILVEDTLPTSIAEIIMPRPAGHAPFFLGIDVGGTNIKLGLLNDAGEVLGEDSIATEQERGPDDACQRVREATRQLIADAHVEASDVVRAGLVTPGPIDIPRGMILRPGNLPAWWDFPVRERMSRHLGLPITFNNDANAAAYGEFWRGAGAQYQSMILLTLGTGVGGGIIIGDLLIDGVHSCGGECGHILIDPSDDAPRDSLGKSGSLESYCNASALVERVTRELAGGGRSLLSDWDAKHDELTPLIVAQAAEGGDELARRCIMETARWLGIGIVSLVHTIDPDAVVIGGAMTFGGNSSPLGQAFLERIRDEARPRMLEPLRQAVRIEFATLGGDAGYIGSAGLARLDYNRKTGPVTTLNPGP
jgi:glucokinase